MSSKFKIYKLSMCPWIIRFSDTVGCWNNTTAQMDLASTYKEMGLGFFLTLFY